MHDIRGGAGILRGGWALLMGARLVLFSGLGSRDDLIEMQQKKKIRQAEQGVCAGASTFFSRKIFVVPCGHFTLKYRALGPKSPCFVPVL